MALVACTLGMPTPSETVAAASHTSGADPGCGFCAGRPLRPCLGAGAADVHRRGDHPPCKLSVSSPPGGRRPRRVTGAFSRAGVSGSRILFSGEYPRHRGEHLGGGPSVLGALPPRSCFGLSALARGSRVCRRAPGECWLCSRCPGPPWYVCPTGVPLVRPSGPSFGSGHQLSAEAPAGGHRGF